jgi:hypothetical protein
MEPCPFWDGAVSFLGWSRVLFGMVSMVNLLIYKQLGQFEI